MAVVMYQRSEPRYKDWLPLLSQQIRLRNFKQLVLVNCPEDAVGQQGYFTLHIGAMSAPFYTSSKTRLEKVTHWPEILVPMHATRLSAPACIVRLWTSEGRQLVSWGVWLHGLHYLGQKAEIKGANFLPKTLVLVTPFGYFTSLCSLIAPPVQPQRFLRTEAPENSPVKASYKLKNLVALYHLQRSVLEEHALADKFTTDMGLHGFRISSVTDLRQQPALLSERLIQRARIGREKLRLKEEIESASSKVKFLMEEKARAEARIQRLKKEAKNYEGISSDLVSKMHSFAAERTNFKEVKTALIGKGQLLSKLRANVFLRKKQLISELLQIYPLELVELSKRFSINGVQLPNAEDYGSETGGQISVALGYTAHLTAMLAFFLDIPCRYPIRHFGSRSRIIDHITVQIPDREREFPLYFKGKRDVYCAYAIYLLNKNISQLRWYCGVSTPDLRATLPNLVELLTTRLIIPGWPPSIDEALEIAQEITEDIDSNFFENDVTLSLDKGLAKLETASISNENSASESCLLLDPFSKENPGGNSTALGDVQHGRSQDRFLSGWKKRTYGETDDFDPKWLMDSMNLDFDSGRRLSLSNSSPPPRPMFVISDEDSRINHRRRKLGRIETPSPELFDDGKNLSSTGPNLQIPPELKRNYTPSKEMARLEMDINESERRKSRVTGIPIDKEKLNAAVHNNNTAAESVSAIPVQSSEYVKDEVIDSSSPVQQIPLPVPTTLPLSDSSAVVVTVDSPGGTIQITTKCDTSYHIPPPVELTEGQVGNADPVPQITQSTPNDAEIEGKALNNTEGSVDFSEATSLLRTASMSDNNGSDKNCDSSTHNPKETHSSTNHEDNLLWMRTEALLGSQSFNRVKRRVSESN